MVELIVIQSISYVLGYIGVFIAGLSFAYNTVTTAKNRKIALTNTLMQTMASEEGVRRQIFLMNMEWTDFDDFIKKYDSRVNEENFAKRQTFIFHCNYLGYLIQEGVVDIGSVYQLIGESVMDMWLRLKPILHRYIEIGDYGKDSFENFEFLANEMIRVKTLKDPGYVRKRIAFPSDRDRFQVPARAIEP